VYRVQSSSLLNHILSALSFLFSSPSWTFTITPLYLSSLLSYLIEIGSLAKFKSKTSSVIILGKEPDATSREKCNGLAASEQLRTLLSKIMMRRTQAEILKRLLPPRTDYVIYCGLTPSQEAEYESTADSLRRYHFTLNYTIHT
jgi:SNF2 family DNA or RNA helicase